MAQALHKALRRLVPVADLLKSFHRLAEPEPMAALGVKVCGGRGRARRQQLGVPEQRALRLGGGVVGALAEEGGRVVLLDVVELRGELLACDNTKGYNTKGYLSRYGIR